MFVICRAGDSYQLKKLCSLRFPAFPLSCCTHRTQSLRLSQPQILQLALLDHPQNSHARPLRMASHFCRSAGFRVESLPRPRQGAEGVATFISRRCIYIYTHNHYIYIIMYIQAAQRKDTRRPSPRTWSFNRKALNPRTVCLAWIVRV